MRVPRAVAVLLVSVVAAGVLTACNTAPRPPSTRPSTDPTAAWGSPLPGDPTDPVGLPSAASAPSPSVLPACAAKATNAQDMNQRTRRIDDLGTADAFRTARLTDGRWVSFTGDGTRPGRTGVHFANSVVIWDDRGQHRVLPEDPDSSFFPAWQDGSVFWPAQAVVSGTKVYVLGSRQLVRGYLNWIAMGAYGAVIEVPPCGRPRFLRYFETPSSGRDDSHVQWYGAIARSGRYLYVHGMLDRPELFHARDGGYVARTTEAELEQHRRWQYWTGSTWSTDRTRAVPTIPASGLQCGDGLGGTEGGYTLHQRPSGQWAVTTKCGGSLGSVLGQYLGPRPWGPFSWSPLLAVQATDSYLVGAAADVPTTTGNLLVYWSRNNNPVVWVEVNR